jgi:hypothetical protein
MSSNGRSLRRQHSQAEQAHGDGGQAQANHTFDGAGQQEGADHQQGQGGAEVLVEREEGCHRPSVGLFAGREKFTIY